MLDQPCGENILDDILTGPQPITSTLVVKPSAVRKHLTKILKKVKQEDFRIVGLRLQILDEELASSLLPPEISEVGLLIGFILSGAFIG